MRALIISLMSLLIKFYRYLLSPLFPQSCRFYPSCSMYALQALHAHNIPKALYLIIARVIRCNPWSSGGYDPVLSDKKRNLNGN